jgi:membrane protein involved in colicin uptake
MSDVLLERIATALEAIAKNGSVGGAVKAPAAATGGAATTGGAAKPDAAAKAAADKKAAEKAAADKAAAKAAADKAAKPAAKPAAAAADKKAAPAAAAATKAPGGKYNSEQVRDIIRKVATNVSLGKQSALDILDQDGGGVTNVTNLKPEFFDAVFEAAQVVLQGEGSSTPAPEDDDDLM